MVVGPLRRDLHITDVQVTYLQGLVFAVFYTFFGILIGRLVDVYSRRTIITIGLILWSPFTTASGIATTFPQMLLLPLRPGAPQAPPPPPPYPLFPHSVPPTPIP